MNFYICKYIRNSASPQKLAAELIGAKMAIIWDLNTPTTSLIRIKPEHWTNNFIRPKIVTTMLGSKYISAVDYVSPSTFNKLAKTSAIIRHLLKIALFDFWVANEDRNENNSNLLYDIINKTLVPIDFGCILNNADFQSQMMQLTTSDTIINSSLFKYLAKDISPQSIQKYAINLHDYYTICVNQCHKRISSIVNDIPPDWNVQKNLVTNKLQQLFDSKWTEAVWGNFEECLTDNI
ncbi:MAG: hypothetical protein IJ197_02780 [Bacteroidaceae bacterium]|nr:hypothetical protein [Bacteroidaceae bacterium]